MESSRHFGGCPSRYKSSNFYPTVVHSDPFEQNEDKKTPLKSSKPGQSNLEELIPIQKLLDDELISQKDRFSRRSVHYTEKKKKESWVSIRKNTSEKSNFVINPKKNNLMLPSCKNLQRQKSLNSRDIICGCNQTFKHASLVKRGDLILEKKVTFK